MIAACAAAAEGEGQNKFAVGNKAILEGIDNPEKIRGLIMDRVRESKGAGLGEEPQRQSRGGWTPQHLEVLREIRSIVKQS